MRAAHTGHILAAAGLGLATSLGIAWSGVSFGVSAAGSETRWHAPGGHDWLVRLWPGPAVDLGVVSLEMPPGGTGPSKSELAGDFMRLLPHAPWRSMVNASLSQAAGGSFWELRAFGWPCKCMAAGYLASASGGRPLGLGWFELGLPGSSRTIDVAGQPIWTGLAANAALFAAPWWIALACSTAAVRNCVHVSRTRRGRCPVCGYDVRGMSGCPECGWAKAGA